MIRKLLSVACLTVASAGLVGTAQAENCPTGIDFNFTESVQFGDGFSQSLPISGLSVPSSPGQIKDCIVVATGVNGGPTVDNPTGMDDAYETPNSPPGNPFIDPYFTTGDSPDPTGDTFVGDVDPTWDTRLTALDAFLGPNANHLFYFNHNQTNAGDSIDQDLFIWAQLILTDDAGVLPRIVYDFTSMPNPFLTNFGLPFGFTSPFDPDGPGGVPPMPFPYDFDATGTNYDTQGLADTNFPEVLPGTFPTLDDFVRARGEICTSNTLGIVPCDGSFGTVDNTFNTNLGADHVANAIFFPELQAILNMKGGVGVDPFGGYDVLSIDFRLGCNPNLVVPGNPDTNFVCPDGSRINNGYEQLFIVKTGTPDFCELNPTNPLCIPTIPVPGSLPLFLLGLLGLVGFTNRKVQS